MHIFFNLVQVVIYVSKIIIINICSRCTQMHTPSAYTYTHACVKEVSYISLTVTCNFEQY